MPYATIPNVPVVSGTYDAQVALGQVILDAETEVRGMVLSADSRYTWRGAGEDGISAFVFGAAGLTSHGEIPHTPWIGCVPQGGIKHAPFCLANQSDASATSITTTYAGFWPNGDPDPGGANTIGVHRISSTGWNAYMLDRKARWINPLIRGHNVLHVPMDALVRGEVLACSNPTSAPALNWVVYGAADHILDNTYTASLDSGNWVTTALASASYFVQRYDTDWVDCSGHEYVAFRLQASNTDRIEHGMGRFSFQPVGHDPRGIWVQPLAQGGAKVTQLGAVFGSCGPWVQGMGPFHAGGILCNVNDALTVPAAQWQLDVEAGVTTLRSIAGNADMPVFIWIQARFVLGASEAAIAARFEEYAGVAQAVAMSMPGVVAINTARTIAQHHFQWVPGGNYTGTYSAAAAYAVGDVMQFTDTFWYRCKTATSAGENPTTHAAKWRRIDAPYNAATTYEYGDCCTNAGEAWAFIDPTPVAGVEPGSEATGAALVWAKMLPYGPSDRVHPVPSGDQLMVDELMKALKSLAGLAEGNAAGFAIGAASGGDLDTAQSTAARSHLASSGEYVAHTPNVSVPAGFVVVAGSFIAFATSHIPANTLGNLKRGGVDWFAQDPVAKAVGDVVYLEAAQSYQRCSKIDTGNLKLGVVVRAALDTDQQCLVAWNG